MTVKELHIGVNFILQKINSNFTDSFKAPQIDWALNEEVIRFMKQRINPQSNDKKLGFDKNQKRFDDLRALVTSAKNLPCYINDDNSVFTYLPADYFSLINDRTATKDLCNKSFNTVQTQNINKYLTAIKINNDTHLYSTFKIIINGITVYDITNYNLSGDLPTSESKFVLINHVIEILNSSGYPCKYYKYFGKTSNESIIILTDVVTNIDVVYNATTISYSSETIQLSSIVSVLNTKEFPNRLTNTEDLFPVLDSSLGGTLVYSPISTLEQDKLIIYHNKKFITNSININYFRKPKKISLSLNQSCELDEAVHTEIIENTAKRLAGLTNSQIYNNIINENLLKE